MLNEEKDSFPWLEILHTKENSTTIEKVIITENEFDVGRSLNASHIIPNVLISRQHCVFKKTKEGWTITDLSKFGISLNGEALTKNISKLLSHKDEVIMDSKGRYKLRFHHCSSDLHPRKKRKITVSKDNFEQSCRRRTNAMMFKINRTQMEMSQIQDQEDLLKQNYKQKVVEIEEKYERDLKLMQQKVTAGLAQQKTFEEEREEIEMKLRSEKDDVRIHYEKQQENLTLKIEQQKETERLLKEENDNLLAQINSERIEFEQRLAEQMLELEQKSKEACLKVEKEKAEVECELRNKLELMEQQLEEEKAQFSQQLKDGTREQQKQAEERRKIEEQLLEQERFAAQNYSEKQQLKEKLEALEKALQEKSEQEKKLAEEIAVKEAQNKQELELLQQKQEEEKKKIKEEMDLREQSVRAHLDAEIVKLIHEKDVLKEKMISEKHQNNDQFQSELSQVQKQLTLMETKKHYLEQELAAAMCQEESKLVAAKQKVLEDLMQSGMQCQICSELFVTATILNCRHTFCKSCITDWKKMKKNPDCPVCREVIKSQTYSIDMDNVIEKMVDSFTDELKDQRHQLLIERGVLGQAEPTRSFNHTRASQGANNVPAMVQGINRRSDGTTNTLNNSVVILTESQDDAGVMESDEDSLSNEDDVYVDGIVGARYGGYGRCSNCGLQGHWAPGCPFNG